MKDLFYIPVLLMLFVFLLHGAYKERDDIVGPFPSPSRGCLQENVGSESDSDEERALVIDDHEETTCSNAHREREATTPPDLTLVESQGAEKQQNTQDPKLPCIQNRALVSRTLCYDLQLKRRSYVLTESEKKDLKDLRSRGVERRPVSQKKAKSQSGSLAPLRSVRKQLARQRANHLSCLKRK
ncbi:MAG: hypothetical protein OXC30_06545 [Alphaproteobacteria bacterium]|nr:hypothetical protein [Alphaproteobacteria bacterium]